MNVSGLQAGLGVLLVGAAIRVGAAPVADAYEPDDAVATAKRIYPGQTQSRTIHAAGNVDWAKIVVGGTGAQGVVLETAGASGDTQVWLFGPNGIGTCVGYNDNSGVGNFSRIAVAALVPGTYYLKIQEYGNNGTIAAYTLKASWTASTADAYESDDAPSTAKNLYMGQTQSRTIHAAGNVDWAKIGVGSSGAQNVVLETAGASGDTQLWLFGPNGIGTCVGYDDNSGVGSFSRISVAALASGTYYAKIQEYGNNGTIPAYTLSLRQVNIANIDEFLKTCPTADPAFNQIKSDFKIRRNGVLVTSFSCAGSPATMPISSYTDELIVLQGLRVLYYMDRGRANHLPWTSLTLYNWMKSKIQGINIVDGGGSSYCCDYFDGKRYVVVAAQDNFNRDFDRKWEGISGNLSLYAHETRHADGYGHVSCCGVANGCDASYNEANLAPYAIQWWLDRAWLTGSLNVGIGCLPASRKQAVAQWHLNNANQTRTRFCNAEPPVLAMPAQPGGTCPQ